MKKNFVLIFLLLAAALGGLLFLRSRTAERPAETAALPVHSSAQPTPSASPSPAPVPTPPPSPEALRRIRAEELLADMSVWEKVCQLFIVRVEALADSPVCTDSAVWSEALGEYPVGGFIFSAENLESRQQTAEMISAMQATSKTGLFISVDEEGGLVARVASTLGTTRFSPMFTYKDDGTETAWANARTIAQDIAALGFNLDFAPVADVWTNPANTVIGSRAYSDDAQEAAGLVASAVRGFTDGGVISVLKHFPGHGSTAEDSHYGLARSDRTPEALAACEFLPFLSGIDAGAGMVMTGHILLSAVDGENPATLSYAVTTQLLRETLGYDGVVVTDALEMGALADYTAGDIAVRAVEAGADLLLSTTDLPAAAEAVRARVDPARLDESVLRILLLKLERGVIE